MHDDDVRTRLGEATSAHAVWSGHASEVASLEAHASAGCSVCARTLVNARELAVDMAIAEAPVQPSEKARSALLSRVSREGKRGAASSGAEAHAKVEAEARAKAEAPAKVRVLDPSATVAHAQVHLPGEAERTREIDSLRASEPRPGEGTDRMLKQLARFLDFDVYIVSIVREERASYRVQLGLPANLRGFRELRREMSYCTHCVSAEAPFIVENAAVEPFFRGNKAVTRYGVRAYAGVPLRTTTGIIVGTLCALGFAPRTIPRETAAVLQVFARRAIAEIERERTPALLDEVIEARSDRSDVYTSSFFGDLLAAERSRPVSMAPRAAPTSGSPGASDAKQPPSREPSVLLTLHAPDLGAARVAEWLDETETAGRLDAATFGLLLPGAGEKVARERAERLAAVAPGVTIAQGR